MLGVAVIGPLALALVIRRGGLAVADMTAPVIDTSIYGFMVGMSVLEDREQGIFTAYRTSPLSARQYLVSAV